jgi:hypothetical protein
VSQNRCGAEGAAQGGVGYRRQAMCWTASGTRFEGGIQGCGVPECLRSATSFCIDRTFSPRSSEARGFPKRSALTFAMVIPWL